MRKEFRYLDQGAPVLGGTSAVPGSRYYLRSVSRTSGTLLLPRFSGPSLGTSRTFSFSDSRDLLEVLRSTSVAEREP